MLSKKDKNNPQKKDKPVSAHTASESELDKPLFLGTGGSFGLSIDSVWGRVSMVIWGGDLVMYGNVEPMVMDGAANPSVFSVPVFIPNFPRNFESNPETCLVTSLVTPVDKNKTC
jgi:hypothetical protein